jgi:hypothetical protein
MFSSLMQRWKVGKKDLVMILFVFAITGFITAWISKAITTWVGFTDETHWSARLFLRLAVLIFGYQALLLLVAFLLGQFSFFWKYEKKILRRLGLIKAEKSSSSET